MSREDIDRLVAERSLALEEFDDAQVAGFWTKAVASYSDARVPGVSSDGAFQPAYTAALQATFAVLAARGLRVKSTKLDDALRRHAVHFDEMRATRHESIYEPDEDDATLVSRLTEAVSYLASALPEIRSWLIAARPGLVRTLRSVDPG